MKFIEPGSLFATSARLEPRVEHVGHEKTPVVTIPGFYREPHRVRRLVRAMPVPNYKQAVGSRNFKDFYWGRQSMDLGHQYEGVVQTVCDVIQQVYGLGVRSSPTLNTNVFQLRKAAAQHVRALPHQDFVLKTADAFERDPPAAVDSFNAVVYLNTRTESRGGTALYRDKQSGMESVPLDPKRYRHYCEHIATAGNFEDGYSYWHQSQSRTWDVHHICPMVFNDLVIFPSSLFHSPWHLPHWFVRYPRITQALFLTGAARG